MTKLIEFADIVFLFLPKLGSSDFTSAAELSNTCIDKISEFSDRCEQEGIETEKIESAKYALAALLDELIVIKSPFGLEWLEYSLAVKLFDDPIAGEGFFIRLDTLKQSSRDVDVLEIYALSLILGFRGRYQIAMPEEVRELVQSCVDLLPGSELKELPFETFYEDVGSLPKEKSGKSFFRIGLVLLTLAVALYFGLVYSAQAAV
jgi:type IV/VI secretion system ImpK/VasF family protein